MLCSLNCGQEAFWHRRGEPICANDPRKCPNYDGLLAKKNELAIAGYSQKFLQLSKYEKVKISNLARRGVTNVMKDSEIVKKQQQTTLENYGVLHPRQNKMINDVALTSYHANNKEEIQKLKVATWLQKYGVDNPAKRKEFKNQLKESRPLGYWIKTIAKRRKTNLVRYGFNSAAENPKTKEKARNTFMRLYGPDVTNASHIPEVRLKQLMNSSKRKMFQLPSGRIVILQGCEPEVLQQLLKSGLKENEIIPHPKIIIWYKNLDGTKHPYFPDFYLPRLNWIIEAKSVWFLNRKGTDQELMAINLAKRKACIDAGYKFNFMLR